MKNEKDVIAAVKKAKVKVDFKKCVGFGEYLDELYKKNHSCEVGRSRVGLRLSHRDETAHGSRSGRADESASAQLIMRGAEVVNAYYHHLHDPLDQRERFEQQQALAEKEGSTRSEALERMRHGLGIDRLTALTGSASLKEVILFPTLRPKVGNLKSTITTPIMLDI